MKELWKFEWILCMSMRNIEPFPNIFKKSICILPICIIPIPPLEICISKTENFEHRNLNMIKSTFVVSQIQIIMQRSFSLKLLHDWAKYRAMHDEYAKGKIYVMLCESLLCSNLIWFYGQWINVNKHERDTKTYLEWYFEELLESKIMHFHRSIQLVWMAVNLR